MDTLSIAAMQYPIDSLLGASSTGLSSAGLSSSSSGTTKIFDLIADQYISKIQTLDISGIYTQDGFLADSGPSSFSMLSAFSTTDDTESINTQLALYQASSTDPLSIFNGQSSSIGDILNVYA